MTDLNGIQQYDELDTQADILSEKLQSIRNLQRWEPCLAEPNEDEDEPVFSGFLTDSKGTWVRWEDLERIVNDRL